MSDPNPDVIYSYELLIPGLHDL